MQFTIEVKTHNLQGLLVGCHVDYHIMSNGEVGHHGVVAQFYHMELSLATIADTSMDLNKVLHKYSQVFEEPTRLLPPQWRDHTIPW